jgi:hypothetical protein
MYGCPGVFTLTKPLIITLTCADDVVRIVTNRNHTDAEVPIIIMALSDIEMRIRAMMNGGEVGDWGEFKPCP